MTPENQETLFMAIELRLEDHMTEEEYERLFNWGEDIWGLGNLELEWRPKDWHIFVDDDGRAATHVGMLKHTVTVGGRPIVVGGVGGVATALDAQGQGYAQSGMRRAASFMSENLGVEFGLLFCRDQLVPFYERLGWQLVNEPTDFEQSKGTMRSPLNVMVLPFGGREWPSGAIRLDSLPW
ncbi:MAG: GNAT family N-acetyltransferase [Pyrinomonadaceae bacterium]